MLYVRGGQIGRIAYQYCCELSRHDVVYAHMRKSNTASRKAAEHAGFVDTTTPEDSHWYWFGNRQALVLDKVGDLSAATDIPRR